MNQHCSSGRSGLRQKRIHEYEVWTNIVTEGEGHFTKNHEYEVWTNIAPMGKADFVRKKKLCT